MHPLTHLEEFKFIKVLYLPPNTIPILQPMDQQVISNSKELFTKHLFRLCFEVTESTNLTLRDLRKDYYCRDMPQNYRNGLAECCREDLDLCVEEAVARGCV